MERPGEKLTGGNLTRWALQQSGGGGLLTRSAREGPAGVGGGALTSQAPTQGLWMSSALGS